MAKRKSIPRNFYAFIFVSVLVVAGFVAFNRQGTVESAMVSAKNVRPPACEAKGTLVINVTQKVVNSVDSGEAGDWWAFDTYNRKIQVWKQSGSTFCALVDYVGTFDAQAGQMSPGNTAVLSGREDGTFKGGYRAIITGALISNPDVATKGSLGTVDYRCDLSGNCPDAFNWTDKYFVTGATGYTFTYGWWGWEYRSGSHVWVNSSDGNSGDIL